MSASHDAEAEGRLVMRHHWKSLHPRNLTYIPKNCHFYRVPLPAFQGPSIWVPPCFRGCTGKQMTNHAGGVIWSLVMEAGHVFEADCDVG